MKSSAFDTSAVLSTAPGSSPPTFVWEARPLAVSATPTGIIEASAPPRVFWFGLSLMVIVAMAVRLWLQFSTPFAPGINGAYYFIQARALLERGELGVPDLPLTFFLHAAVAWILQHAFGLDQNASIMTSVRTLDAVLPPLAAVPVALLGWRWRTHDQPSILSMIAPAVLVCLSAGTLRMLGDFAKNSLGLIWLAALMLAAHHFLDRPTWKRAVWPLTFLALCGLTHIGVFGAALVFLLALLLSSVFFQDAELRRRTIGFAVAAAGLLVLVAAVLSFFDASRLQRLVSAVASPASFAGSGGGPGGPSGGLQLTGWLYLGLGVWTLWLIWQQHASQPGAHLTVATAAALTTLIIGGPFYDGDKSMRLSLIALVPAAVALQFVLAQMALTQRQVLSGVLLTFVWLSSLGYLSRGAHSTLTPQSYAELQSLQTQVPAGAKTLVVARHGLEWWTAWVLHTHIAQPTAVTPEDWQRFEHVYYLAENRRSRRFPGPPGGFHFGGPPGGFPPPGAPPFGRGATFGANPMASAEIPQDAELLHNGRYFKLARVQQAPEELLVSRAGLR